MENARGHWWTVYKAKKSGGECADTGDKKGQAREVQEGLMNIEERHW
jgi:hypothetical protein